MTPEFIYSQLIKEIEDYAIFMLDINGNISSWNLGAEKIKGYKEEEVIGKNFSIFYPEENRRTGFPQKFLAEAKQHGRAEHTGYRVRKDGSVFWGNIIIKAVYNDNGECIGFMKITRDLTSLMFANQKLERSEQRLSNFIQSAPDAIIIVDRSGRIVLTNRMCHQLFQYSNNELEGSLIENLIPERYRQAHENHRRSFIPQSEGMMMGKGNALAGLKKDGTEFNVEITLSRIVTENENEFLIAAAIRDVTSRTRAEEKILELNRILEQRSGELENLLREKITMIKEIHHRVKNNLQTVASLLKIQANRIEDSSAVKYLRASEHRVQSMAMIHMNLYNTKNLSLISLKKYTEELCSHLIHAFGVDSRAINVDIDIDDGFFSIDTALPCGLILNELFSNSLKYAFPDNRSGNIKIRLVKGQNGYYHLFYSDNGVGFDKDKDDIDASKLGMLLVNTLAEQLEAEVKLSSKGGIRYEFIFKEVEHKAYYINK